MMRAVFVCILALLFIVQIASAAEMKVDIIDNVLIDVKTTPTQTGNFIEIATGAHNTGSLSYDARIRMDTISDKDIVSTGWSSKISIAPGQRKSFKIYGYKPELEDLSVRVRAYYGNEITELESISLNGVEGINPKTSFSIMNFRTYNNYIRMDVTSNQTLDNIVVFLDLPGTWISEQVVIDHIENGAIKEVIIPYETGFFQQLNVSASIATMDGEYYQESSFQLVRETGIMKYVHLIMDYVGVLFRS